MKDYMKPELEKVEFVTENVATGPDLETPYGGDNVQE